MKVTAKISACIICKNEVHRITAALDSLVWCEDVVVVDSGSTDGTLEKAAAHPCKPRVISQSWLGFNPQRKFAVEQCRHEWVLMLDADEECSEALAEEIRGLADDAWETAALFEMPRHNFMAGRYIRCWSPDYQSRLVHKDRVVWDPRPLPEKRDAKPGYHTRKLRHPLWHNRRTPFALSDVNDGQKLVAYSELLAQHMMQRGQRASWGNLLFRPMAAFVKYYILKGGFLDGRFGLVIAYKGMIGVMLKYSVLYAKEELEKHK